MTDAVVQSQGGINTNVRFGGIYIKTLVSGGAAELDARIQIGKQTQSVERCGGFTSFR